MSFKDQVASDNLDVFLNTDEFADVYTIRYNEKVFENVKAVRRTAQDLPKRGTGSMYIHDYSQGFYLRTDIVHLRRCDIGNYVPETGTKFEMEKDDGFYERYYVKKSIDDMGMLRLELEVWGE